MDSFYKKSVSPLTEEEQAIDAAADAHSAAVEEEKFVTRLATILFIFGMLLTLFTPSESRFQRVGSAIAFCGLLCFAFSFLLSIRTHKRKLEAKELINPYLRRLTLPFYNELTEMFAKKPGIHLHLNDNGTITVTDKRKREETKNNA